MIRDGDEITTKIEVAFIIKLNEFENIWSRLQLESIFI